MPVSSNLIAWINFFPVLVVYLEVRVKVVSGAKGVIGRQGKPGRIGYKQAN